MFCYFVNELNYIFWVQVLYTKCYKVRKGQSRTSWLDPCLPSRGTEQDNLCLTSPCLPLLNRLQTHLSAAADWPSLRRTKSPTGGPGCWVSVISRPGKSVPLFIFCSRGWVFSFPKDALWPISPCLDNRQVVSYSVVCVCAEIAKYIKPLDFAKCCLKCLLALVATKQLLSVHLVLFYIRLSWSQFLSRMTDIRPDNWFTFFALAVVNR